MACGKVMSKQMIMILSALLEVIRMLVVIRGKLGFKSAIEQPSLHITQPIRAESSRKGAIHTPTGVEIRLEWKRSTCLWWNNPYNKCVIKSEELFFA